MHSIKGLLVVLMMVSGTLLAAIPASKDAVSIDQKNYRIVAIPVSRSSQRTAKVLLQLQTKVVLASQERSYLRAAINLDAPESFRPVFSKEVERGAKEHQIDLEIVNPKQKVIRVVVWLDKESGSASPKPLATDNIAFDGSQFAN